MRLLLCGFLLILVGCSKSGPELPVSGIVTLDGNPLADVTVRFYPDTGTDPTSSGYAQTGTDGKFVITGGKGQKGSGRREVQGHGQQGHGQGRE